VGEEPAAWSAGEPELQTPSDKEQSPTTASPSIVKSEKLSFLASGLAAVLAILPVVVQVVSDTGQVYPRTVWLLLIPLVAFVFILTVAMADVQKDRRRAPKVWALADEAWDAALAGGEEGDD
jgi:hypothetical protein